MLSLAVKIHSNMSVDMGQWVYLAGSVQRGVIVVSDNDGTELFSTPSLYQSLSLRVNADFGSLKDSIEQARSRGMDGNKPFEDHINSSNAIISTPANLANFSLDWAKIFSRYGYKMVPVNKEAAALSVDPLAPTPIIDGTDTFV
jgi:hypothetical protein